MRRRGAPPPAPVRQPGPAPRRDATQRDPPDRAFTNPTQPSHPQPTQPPQRYTTVVLDSLAYAGSGNVLKVQELLALCGDHAPEEDDAKPAEPAAAAAAGAAAGAAAAGGAAAAAAGSGAASSGGNAEWRSAHQWPAVVGLALIAMGEPLGARMAQRALEHLLQYGEPVVRCGRGSGC
jgi:26S proteasome regulatory subunit N1